MKKITAMTLLLAMALSVASCGGGNGDTNNDTTTSAGGDTTTAAPEDTSPKLELPDKNFGGTEFTILSSDLNSYEYDAEEQTGDIVEDAVYKRNSKVEELLGVDFNIISQPGDWPARDTFNGLIKNSVLAGDGEYDLISGVAVIVMQLSTEGYFVNANNLKYIDFDNPWWVQGMNDNLAIDGKLYGFIGDASLSLYKDLSVLYFNKKILNDYNLENPYQYVYDDNWNIDTFGGMLKGVSSDLNSDGKLKWGEDMVGFMTNSVPNRAFMTATEITFLNYDNGSPSFGELSERSVNVFEKLYKVFKENDNVLNNPKDEYDIATQYFTEDKALFMDAFLKYADNMRNMTSDFGIVPYPKADSTQEKYHTQIGTSTSTFFVPITAKDKDMTAMVCEALSYYSMQDVTPTYYEVALKEKYTRDDDVKNMLEIIRDGAQMDFGFAYSTLFDPSPNVLTEFRSSYVIDNITTYYAKYQQKWQATLEDIVEKYSTLD